MGPHHPGITRGIGNARGRGYSGGGGGFLRRSLWKSREERDEERVFRETAERELEERKAEEQISEEVGRKRREEEMSGAANAQHPPLQNLSGRTERKGQEAISRGGFANIYFGTLDKSRAQSKTRVAVAFKVLLAAERGPDGKDSKKIKGALRELAIWHLLSDHPRILPLFGFSLELGHYPTMICPWMDKGSLRDYLNAAGSSLSVFDQRRILCQVVSGLIYVHSRSIVHGDLSCSNILIDGNGDAFLCDFGLSSFVSASQGAPSTNEIHNTLLAARLSMDSEVFHNFEAPMLQYQSSQGDGNIRFMAPELHHFGDESEGDHRKTIFSDVYALGGIILETLTGKTPYHDLKGNAAAIVLHISRGELPFRREASSTITDDQWKLLCACWAKEPAERPVLSAILQFLQDPDNRYTSEISVLPHRTDITLSVIVDRSAGGIKETWISEETGIVKVFRLLPERHKDTILEAIRSIGIIQHRNIHPYVATAEFQDLSGVLVGVVAPSILNRTLSMYLETSSVPAHKKLIILHDIASGLSHLHSMTIVHGGLTGESVHIDEAGDVKLCDFGLMPLLYRHATPSDCRTAYIKDFRWADPCLWYHLFIHRGDNGRGEETLATDIYAFGCVAYQVMFNEMPFRHILPDERMLWYTTLRLTPELFRPQKPSMVSDNLWELIQSWWHVDHEARPSINGILWQLEDPVIQNWILKNSSHTPQQSRGVLNHL